MGSERRRMPVAARTASVQIVVR